MASSRYYEDDNCAEASYTIYEVPQPLRGDHREVMMGFFKECCGRAPPAGNLVG